MTVFLRAPAPCRPLLHPALSRAAYAATALLLFGMLTAQPLWAQSDNRVLNLAGLYQNDIRARAMGNSYVAMARGEGALLYNPAGLVQPTADIKLEGAVDALGSGGEFLNDSLALTTDGLSTNDMLDYLETYKRTTQDYAYQTFGHALAGMGGLNFGLGYGSMDVNTYRFDFQDPSDTPNDITDDQLELVQDRLAIQFAAAAFSLLDGQILLGATAKSFTYTSSRELYNFTDLVLSGDLDAASTTLLDESYQATTYDVGIIYRMEAFSFLRGQWGLNVVNVGGLELTGDLVDLDVPMTFNFGMSFNPPMPLGNLLLHFEIEDVGDSITIRDDTGDDHKRSVTQRIHYGAEYGLWETSFGNHVLNVRAGMNRGQLAYGAEINLWSGLRIAFTRYQDDLGHADESDVTPVLSQAHVGIGFGF